MELLLSLFALLAGFTGITGGRVADVRQVQAGSAFVEMAREAAPVRQAAARVVAQAPVPPARIAQPRAPLAARPLIGFVAKDERRLE